MINSQNNTTVYCTIKDKLFVVYFRIFYTISMKILRRYYTQHCQEGSPELDL